MKKDLKERAKLVRAMDYIARCVNDESIFDSWLMNGVADGDITEYFISDELSDVEWYIENDAQLQDLMSLFLRLMKRAEKSGGLYCNGVVSE